MKKYKVFKNNTYLESFDRRYMAEEAIRQHKREDEWNAVLNRTYNPCNIYDIRR